ncbi:hypothetical protein [Natronococcus sp. A-GB7]|uniref:hypothetical protein n=1 Tax=Natronococcus sp. A-GB7 TaxID=3037649 RepID=UPI00241CFD74|nr:hypothetical protein [Natronococcus sp. A-GB7]MDG5818355.1 hypothetical protein [Natronococcus sp. A-GB7]
MDRRRYLAACLGGAVGLSGCLGSLEGETDDSPDVDGAEPEFQPGTAGELELEANGVVGLSVSAPGDTGFAGLDDAPVELDLGRGSPTPSPDRQLDSFPPVWLWDDRTDVEIRLPVTVAEDAPPGEYPYGITVYGDDDREDSNRFEFSITVLES